MIGEPGTARKEAEKLVAAVLAAATLTANANPHWSTGSSECCVCPLCKVIAAVRDPDPEMVERLATGAGDLAAGMASFLRHVATPSTAGSAWESATASDSSRPSTSSSAPASPASAGRRSAPASSQPVPRPASPARASSAASATAVPPPVKKMAEKRVAKKVVKKAVKKAAPKKAG